MMKYIASVSFGKDSMAMLLRLLEENAPLDEVVFYDTGMEFNAIYRLRDLILPVLLARGIKYTELKPSCPFLFKMFEHVKTRGENIGQKGYSWCGGACRWGTTEKLKALERYSKDCFEYIGIAADEPKRLIKERKGHKLFPLNEWSMTEADCLKYCRIRGYRWMEGDIDLYDILKRVSCWCCGNKNLTELRNYYLFLPQYWQKLKELQARTDRPFPNGKTIFELEKRFKSEIRSKK